MRGVPPQSSGLPKVNPEKDPHITPWQEDEPRSDPLPVRRPDRGMRDWLVLGLAGLLLFYVILFLVVGPQLPSGKSAGFWPSGGGIAVIPLKGEISSSTGSDSIGFQDVVNALEEAENDESVRVIFLDIESGGGSVVSSKQIVAKLREIEKPTVSWIGEVGASGAYYAASATDYVMADADSITGSIGVISVQPNVKDLFEKIGVKVESIKTGNLKDAGSPFDELTPEEKQIFQLLVEQAFEAFKSDLISFRGEKLDRTKFEPVLDGRILSGKQAMEIGLIDELGTREAAIKKAVELGGIQGEPTLIPYLEKPFTLRDFLFSAGVEFGKGLKAAWTSPVSSSNNGLFAK